MTENNPPLSPSEHIAQIRREFGIGITGDVRKDRVSKNLHRAIQRLSEDLYSKDIHFVLELIQNAEDNHYHADHEPDLIFSILLDDPTNTPGASGALLLINNEKGFDQENVNAICAIGETTKDKREGYIGEKGIGFKSAFLVSSQPHIFSAGYQFKFNEEKDPEAGFGFIVPYWVPEAYQVTTKHLNKTCILLPLKPGKRDHVEAQLRQIAPETILFLRKLKCLKIQIGEEIIAEVVRDDQHKPQVDFLKGDIDARYWLIEKEFKVPEDVVEEKRVQITNRMISIAFPLADSDGLTDTVYAFLPTQVKSGFNFLVNADFLLSSNRESIRENLPWNTWIRDCVAPTFIEAFESLLHFDHQEYKLKPYLFIPLPNEVADPFFRPSAEEIIKELSSRPVIWTEDDITLIEPNQARFAPTWFRKLLGNDERPNRLIQTPLVHPILDSDAFVVKLRALGVKQLSPTEIIDCLKDDDWLNRKDAKWFISLYTRLSDLDWAKRENLDDIAIIRIEGGSRRNGQNSWVYFPTESSQEFLRSCEEVFSFLDIEFLDKEIFQAVETQDKLRSWLSIVLDVEDLTIQNLCLHLATDLSQRRTELSADQLVRLSKFIRDHYEQLDENTRSQIKANLPLLINENKIISPEKWEREKPLVLPNNLETDTDWQFLFPMPNDRTHMTIISSDYLENASDKQEQDKWRIFFVSLGATDAPWPRKRKWKYSYNLPNDVPPHLLKIIRENYGWSTRDYKLDDWAALSWLSQTLEYPGQSTILNRAKALIQWLNRQLSGSTTYNEWVHSEFGWFYRYWRYQSYESEFLYQIKNIPWFPSTKGIKRPSEVFLNKPEIKEFFGDTLAYSVLEVTDLVASFLHLRTSATLEQILALLHELAGQPAKEVHPKQVERIYAFISERWTPSLKAEFQKKALILSTKPNPTWVTTNQAIWPDRYDVFGDAYVYLESQYGSLGNFFTNLVGVARDVSEKEYAQAWINLCKLTTPEPVKVEAALERIYPVLLKVVNEGDKPEWWDWFTRDIQVWTQKDRFLGFSTVFIPDDGEMKSTLEAVGAEFVWRPTKDSFVDFLPLYQAVGVRSLSGTTRIEASVFPLPSGSSENSPHLLTDDAKKGICYYLRNIVRDQYELLKRNGLLETFLKTSEQLVSQMSIQYSLEGKTARVSNGVTFWDQEQCALYLSIQHNRDVWETEVPSALSRRLVNTQSAKDLENFIGWILGSSSGKVNGIIRKQNWYLPEEERSWINQLLIHEVVTGSVVAGEVRGTLPQSISAEESSIRTASSTTSNGRPHQGTQTSEGKERSSPDKRYGDGTTQSTPAPYGDPTDHWRPRLRSYVEKSGERSSEIDGKGEKSHETREVEQAGISFVMAYERSHGRDPEELPVNHEGWDINSREGTIIRRIEVKATKFQWDGWGIGLTAPEFNAARKYGDDYYLYVVENALDPVRRTPPFIFRNPVGKITDYRFDDQWKKIGYQEDVNPAQQDTEFVDRVEFQVD